MIGEVTEVFLKDGNPDDIYKIKVNIKSTRMVDMFDEVAFPINPHIKSIPVIGEIVYIISADNETSNLYDVKTSYYYISSIFLQKRINTNLLPGIVNKVLDIGIDINDYDSSAVPISQPIINSKSDNQLPFSQINDLSQIQPYAGDTIFEGRFGQSIRFGYTPKNSGASKNPNWNSSVSNAPITIIRNTQNDTNKKGYDKFVVESISEDDSSIWMTSKQKVATKLASKSVISNISEYTNPQVIINSDRLIFNSRNDSVIVSAKKDIFFSTTKTKTSVDLIVEALEILANGTFPTAVGPTGPHPQLADILKKLKNI